MACLINLFITLINTELTLSKLMLLQKTISTPPINTTFSVIIPLLSSVLGGFLVLAGQAIERNNKRKLEKANMLLDIYTYCRKAEALLKNNYRELAMAKSHVEYWWHVSISSSSSESQKQRGYDEHLRSQAYAREIERKIGDNKADYIANIRRFQALHQTNDEIENNIEKIFELTYSKARSYDQTLTHEQVRNELFDQDEKKLREIYYKNLAPFISINNNLKKLLNYSKN